MRLTAWILCGKPPRRSRNVHPWNDFLPAVAFHIDANIGAVRPFPDRQAESGKQDIVDIRSIRLMHFRQQQTSLRFFFVLYQISLPYKMTEAGKISVLHAYFNGDDRL